MTETPLKEKFMVEDKDEHKETSKPPADNVAAQELETAAAVDGGNNTSEEIPIGLK